MPTPSYPAFPHTARLNALMDALEGALSGPELTLRREPAATPTSYPAAVLLYSRQPYSVEELKALEGYVKAGGGLVYLEAGGSSRAKHNATLLEELGVRINARRASRGAPELTEHAMASGVTGLPPVSASSIEGPVVDPVAFVNSTLVAAAVPVQAGRLVVIHSALVTAADRGKPTPGQVRLLANACLWAARREIAPAADEPLLETPQPEPEATTRPQRKVLAERDRWPRPMRAVLQRERSDPSQDFAGALLVDILAADDGWSAIAEALDKSLEAASGPVRYLETKSASSPLVSALEGGPALLVLGSTRRFDATEAIAVANYVRLGGRLLAIFHAGPAYTARIVDLNVVLNEFGIAASLGRPQGPSLLEEHPIAEGLPLLPSLAGGVAIWSVVADPVAKTGKTPYLSALERDGGRVVALDGRMLIGPRTRRGQTTPPPEPFVKLLDAAIAWLLER